MSLKFSVITPSFRQGCFIERTIQSVLSQNIEDMEYIICDGGSDDETVEILKKYHQKLRWISEADKGQSDAVNKGISMTTGDIIAWINSDDIYYPEAFQTVKQVFESKPEIEVVYGDADWINELDDIIYPYPTEDWNYKRLIETCYICQPAVFFKRSLIERFGSLDTSLDYCMDYELWLRYGKYVDFYHIPQKMAGSRMYKTNKTVSKKLQAHYEVTQMHKQKFGNIPDNWTMAYAFVKAEETTKLDRFDDNQVKILIWNSLIEIIKLKSGISLKIIIKIIFWWFFPNLSWFRKLKLLEYKNI
ncbi:glycosyltransferase [Fortiea sp. LEGE XX443]|uniref:glycosyltransferase family 2 protein n=1 Tax=Fortiea sp. LEGE XX443 TaxID=1828611 RepID=UPI001881CBFB|nr:glycosyltransferase family 2 protein [Fortiea sp. LEGE XX443]MBE9007109.1 glycosyltransferase [Fortiea sp. LEGE XX443]